MPRSISGRLSSGLVLGTVAATSLAAAAPARAQLTVDELQQEIQRRDAQIEQLIRRMDQLEKQVHAEHTPPHPTRQAQAKATPAEPGVSMPPPLPTAAVTAAPEAPTGAVPPATPTASTTASAQPTEDELLSRALENTLVNQGGQLLPPGFYQLVPDFSYTHQSLNQLACVNNNGCATIVQQQSHRNLLEWGFGFRIGLPWETQLNVRVPFDLDSGSATLGGEALTRNRGGIGDVSLLLQKQVLHEKGMLPDLLVNVGYSAATGSTTVNQPSPSTFPFSVGTGSGFNEITTGAIALKRQDPLVFLLGAQYTHAFPATYNGASQNPGDQYLFRAEAILAASPDTSLRFGWLNTFEQRNTIRGVPQTGTGQQFSNLEIGIGSIISPKIYLDAQLLVGLTRDTPDFSVALSLPFRF